MKNEWDAKECFGQQASDILYGKPPYKCLECEIFDKCHKITVAASLQAISSDLDLITQNGLVTKKLMALDELLELEGVDMTKPN